MTRDSVSISKLDTTRERPAIRAALLDFDGTLARDDLTSLLAERNGRREQSDRLNRQFHAGQLSGVTALIERINMLDGISLSELNDILCERDHLMTGAIELFEYFRDNGIVTIVASGSIMPILEHYQQILGIDYLVGTSAALDGDVIRGVDSAKPPVDGFKLAGCMSILTALEIPVSRALAIGDSPADAGMLLHAGLSIAINPVGGVERFADHVIHDDLTPVMTILMGAPTRNSA